MERRDCPDAAYFALASADFNQNWTAVAQIAGDDDWSAVPSIIGYRGDGLTAAPGDDPRTVAGESGVVDVTANQLDPNSLVAGGVAEFEIADPTVALKGDAIAGAPHLQIHIDTTSVSDVVRVYYQLRDLDGTANNVASQVALQYRVGTSGPFTDVPVAYVADASTGGTATTVTSVFAALPPAVNNQANVQIRIITTDAVGNDEWIGVDNIQVGIRGDYGDAPLSYGTATAVHRNTGSSSPLRLGTAPLDYEVPPAGALIGTQDDTVYGGDDEDGVKFTATVAGVATFVPNTTMTVIVAPSANGKLDGWIDFNRDGDFDDAGEQIAANVAITYGGVAPFSDNLISFPVPANASVGVSYARFRVSSAGGLSPTDMAIDGEVEDYQVNIGPLTGGQVVLNLANGWNGYTDTQDVTIVQADDTFRGNEASLNVDPSGSGSSGNRIYTNIQFDNLFGSGPLQIPAGSTISSATLYAAQSSGSGESPASVYRMLIDWDETLTWVNAASLPGGNGSQGVQVDNVEASSSATTSMTGGTRFGFTEVFMPVTPDVSYWSSNANKNFGWTIQKNSGQTRGIDFHSSESASALFRPRIIVTYTPAVVAPTVTAINPVTGPSSGGTVVTISGANFTAGSTVAFGGTAAASVTFVSATQLTATTPAHASGSVDVVVTTAGGSGSLPGAFEYLASPVVTSVIAYVGPTSGGNYVVIAGSGFTGVSAVAFGVNASISFTEAGGTLITALVPGGSAGLIDVKVTTPGGISATAGTGDDYTYAVPVVLSVEVNGGEIQATDALGVVPVLAGQNAIVEQLLVTFNQAVTLDSGAFAIQSLAGDVLVSGGISPSLANVSVTATGRSGFGTVATGFTQYILTFDPGAGTTTQDNTATGNGGIGNIFQYLKDGFYQLDSDGTKIHAGGTLLGETGTSASDKFWALYGAALPGVNVFPSSPLGDGNSVLLVDSFALDDIYASFGSFSIDPVGPPPYDTAYDSNLDGLMDSFDLDAMYANFGTVWQF